MHTMPTDKTDGAPRTPRASLSSISGCISESRLSPISCNTKYAVALNQIDRIEISAAHDRTDGVTLYVVDIYLLCVQTGIPKISRAPPPTSNGQRRYRWYERRTGWDDNDECKDPLLRKREREKNPHYRIAYRFSEFFELRKELRDVVEESLHSKWCAYCGSLDWIVNDSPFPSRCVPLLNTLVDRIACLKRWRTRRRKRKLELFLREIVYGARSMQYRNSGEQCDGFLNTAYVLKEFLSEPHMRQSCTGW
jgi:hypothetical protein